MLTTHDCVFQFVLGYAICVISATKFRSMDTQVLFRSFCAKITQSHTAITSIVFVQDSFENLKI